MHRSVKTKSIIPLWSGHSSRGMTLLRFGLQLVWWARLRAKLIWSNRWALAILSSHLFPLTTAERSISVWTADFCLAGKSFLEVIRDLVSCYWIWIRVRIGLIWIVGSVRPRVFKYTVSRRGIIARWELLIEDLLVIIARILLTSWVGTLNSLTLLQDIRCESRSKLFPTRKYIIRYCCDLEWRVNDTSIELIFLVTFEQMGLWDGLDNEILGTWLDMNSLLWWLCQLGHESLVRFLRHGSFTSLRRLKSCLFLVQYAHGDDNVLQLGNLGFQITVLLQDLYFIKLS